MVPESSSRRCYHFRMKPAALAATMRCLFLSLLLQALLAACTERSRLNPIDPENPRTGGKPTGLRIIAELDTVRLFWDALALRDLSGFNVYRKLPTENDFVRIGHTAAQINAYQDLSDRFGTLHSYRITARVGDLETRPSEEATVTPGPTIVWVADSDSRAVIKLTHDGQHEILRSRAFLNPFRLKVDNRRGSVWVLDEYTGNFGRLNQKGELLGIYEQFYAPVGLALDLEDGSIWVGDNGEHVLAHFDNDGRLLARIDTLPNLAALAFHPNRNELWALTTNGEQLLRVGKNSMQIARVQLQPSWNGPVRDLAVHAGTGAAWLAAGDRVVRLQADGQVSFVSTEEFRFASRIAIDQVSGVCWVIDDSREFRDNSSVFKLDASGQVLLRVDGFERPQSLAVNPYDAACYVLDTLRGRLVKIAVDGKFTTGYENFLTPYDIDVVMPVR